MDQHLIVSPHIDDAWFDLGGSIHEWHKAGDAVKVIDVFSVQSWAINSDASPSQVGRIRRREERLNARRDGVSLEFLDLPEAPLRGCELKFPDEINWSRDHQLLNGMIAVLRKLEVSSGTIYFPLGIGGHVDHLLAREAFTTLRPHFFALGVDVVFYEDLPYASYFELPADFIFRHQLVPSLQEIDIEHKLTSVLNYKSQVTDELLTAIKAYAYNLSPDGKPYERVWRMNAKRRDPDQIEVL